MAPLGGNRRGIRTGTSCGLGLAFMALTASLGSLGSLGCNGGPSAEQKQLAEMKETLARVQADNDRMAERVARLEVDDPHGTPSDSAYGVAKPASLKVVHLGPSMATAPETETTAGETAAASSKAPASDDPDDASQRPVIRLSGNALRDRNTRKGLHAADSGAQDPEARKAYDDALAKVQKKEYPAALEAFNAFLVKWPDHPRADNAMYWRGECYFAEGDFSQAETVFAGTIARFPTGNKVPDALLKLAMSQEKLGQTESATTSYSRLAHDFPKSDAARKVPANMVNPSASPSQESQ